MCSQKKTSTGVVGFLSSDPVCRFERRRRPPLYSTFGLGVHELEYQVLIMLRSTEVVLRKAEKG